MSLDVSQVKSQVADALRSKNGASTAGMVRSGSFGVDRPHSSPIMPMVFGGAVLIGITGMFLLMRPNQAVQQSNTGQAQIDQAMAMLANQQAINDKLLQGQQELSKTIIENAKPDHTTILCIGSRVCPGNAPSDGGVMVTPSEPPVDQPYETQSVSYVSDVDRAWQQHYLRMREGNPVLFSNTWNVCTANWQRFDKEVNCPNLAHVINGEVSQ